MSNIQGSKSKNLDLIGPEIGEGAEKTLQLLLLTSLRFQIMYSFHDIKYKRYYAHLDRNTSQQ